MYSKNPVRSYGDPISICNMYSKNPVKSDQDAEKTLLVNECLIKKQITIFVP